MQVPVVHILEGLRGQLGCFSHEFIFFVTLRIVSEALEEIAQRIFIHGGFKNESECGLEQYNFVRPAFGRRLGHLTFRGPF